jgi:hypothetical protein
MDAPHENDDITTGYTNGELSAGFSDPMTLPYTPFGAGLPPTIPTGGPDTSTPYSAPYGDDTATGPAPEPVGFQDSARGMPIGMILEDLEGAEARAYAEAFVMFDDLQTGFVGLDHELFREWLCANTGVGRADLDGELFRVNDTGQFSAADFIAFCREHAVSTDLLAQQWTAFGGSADPTEQMPAPEVRTALAIMLEDALGPQKPDEAKLDVIFDWAMADTEFALTRAQFVAVGKKVCRACRVVMQT